MIARWMNIILLLYASSHISLSSITTTTYPVEKDCDNVITDMLSVSIGGTSIWAKIYRDYCEKRLYIGAF